MIILKKWAFLACFLLLVIPCAFLSAAADESAVYYVSQNGDDSADGSSAETAFQTLSAAVSAIGDRDGTVYIVDTAYWSENKSACLVPSYSGVITFEGLHSDSVIDFSRSHAKSTEAADLNLVGSAVFRHITLRTHAHKKIFTYGYDLTMQNVRFTDTENREEKADLVIGKYGKPCTGSRVKIIDSVPLRNIYVGYSRASALTTKTELHILGARVENVILCGMGCTVGNVDLIYQNAWVDKTTVGNNSGEAKIAGHLRVIHNADAFSIEKLSEASPSLYTELHCADGGFVTPLSGETGSDETRSGKTSSDENGGSYSVPDGKTALCTDENQVLFVSAHGGYVRLPDGRKYTVRFSDEPYYTDDGETIRIQNPLSLPFSDGLFLTEKDGLFCGWCYEGQNFGPREADILPSGTVLTAYYEENGVPSIRGVRINIGEKKVRVLADGGTSGGAYEKRYGLLILSADILGKNELLLNQTYPFEESEIAPSVLYSEAASGTYAAETGGIVRERYGERFAARPFVTYTDANGLFRTVYGETRVFSVSDIAKENKISARNERDREMFNMIRQQEREAYYGKNMENTTAIEIPNYEKAYIVNDTGVRVREIEVKAVTPLDTPIEIDMISDSHIKRDDHFIEALRRAAACASLADKTVFCGDNLDSVSDDRNVALFRELIWDPYPDALCVVGNHEGFFGDYDTIRQKVSDIWPHDSYYYTERIGSVLLICLDDAAGTVSDTQCNMLESDIAAARERGETILLFHHIRFTTLDSAKAANDRFKKLIKGNADCIRAVFAGHNHADMTGEIEASYLDSDGNRVQTKIPYYQILGCPDNGTMGNVLRITVK